MPDPMSEEHLREIEELAHPCSYVPELIACIRRLRAETRDDRIAQLEESDARKSRDIDDLISRLKRMQGERDMAQQQVEMLRRVTPDDEARDRARQLRDYLNELFFDGE